MRKIGQKSFLIYWKILVINFLSDWSLMKVYVNCCILAQNPIFGKNPVPEIWTKMLLANQIARFLNQLYL